MNYVPRQRLKLRRSVAVIIVALLVMLLGAVTNSRPPATSFNDVLSEQAEGQELARDVLEGLTVKGRAPKTDYSRDEFGSGWASVDGCDLRNIMLKRSLTELNIAEDGCVVLSGQLLDPYTDTTIAFVRGRTTSDGVQIDHVVALSDAWQKGAQQLEYDQRVLLANDPLNLLAVDGPANQQKGNSDAASWLPSNRGFRCQYVARQIAVKDVYSLWVTAAEKAVMQRILNGCGEQRVPLATFQK